MARWVRALLGGVVLCVLVQALGFAGCCEGIRQRVVRLHVLAHSNSEADQALKLQVRDAVTAAAEGLLSGDETRTQALETLQAALPALQEAAQAQVYAAGQTYPVTVQLTKTAFTTRTYEDITLPAGVYDALQVTIGDGAGRNWWCVVYPPLCVSAAVDADALDAVLTEGQQTVTRTPRYAVRFKVVEWWYALFGGR